MNNGTPPAMRSKILRCVLTFVASCMVAAIFVPISVALLPEAMQASFSDVELSWLVLVIGTAISALVLWATRSREQ
ncbi:hypothetical protein [Actinacidiphila sp. bgisy167]|uniref:hypothetical protein n=1 Tax=Actinacidiphila sp. bgisy167 TaxID=3413797 RepID=UPI003D7072B0